MAAPTHLSWLFSLHHRFILAIQRKGPPRKGQKHRLTPWWRNSRCTPSSLEVAAFLDGFIRPIIVLEGRPSIVSAYPYPSKTPRLLGISNAKDSKLWDRMCRLVEHYAVSAVFAVQFFHCAILRATAPP